MPATQAKYGRDEHLTLTYRGATIRLEADDPRLAFIELLLFGKTLPRPFPAPDSSERAGDESKSVDVPQAWVTFWNSLPDLHRRVLEELAGETLTALAIESRLVLGSEAMRSINILVALRAKEAGLAMPVKSIGRGRKGRRYHLDNTERAWVLELARRWTIVREAKNGTRR